jgi:hypothetical protein
VNPPTREEALAAYQVIQFLLQPRLCLTTDAIHLIHAARLLAEYVLTCTDAAAAAS